MTPPPAQKAVIVAPPPLKSNLIPSAATVLLHLKVMKPVYLRPAWRLLTVRSVRLANVVVLFAVASAVRRFDPLHWNQPLEFVPPSPIWITFVACRLIPTSLFQMTRLCGMMLEAESAP